MRPPLRGRSRASTVRLSCCLHLDSCARFQGSQGCHRELYPGAHQSAAAARRRAFVALLSRFRRCDLRGISAVGIYRYSSAGSPGGSGSLEVGFRPKPDVCFGSGTVATLTAGLGGRRTLNLRGDLIRLVCIVANLAKMRSSIRAGPAG
jgi:hypothetical protein